MTRRPSATLPLAAALALVLAACGGNPPSPTLTDPNAIVTAALDSTAAATSVHLEFTLDGAATVELPIGGGAAAPIDLTGATASADIDLAGSAASATFGVPAVFNFSGALTSVDGWVYVKTSLTGPLYQKSAGAAAALDPGAAKRMILGLRGLLDTEGLVLVKGADVACGGVQCYTVTTDLTSAQLGTDGTGALDGLPINLAGASLQLTIRVEQPAPNHLAGITAVVAFPSSPPLTIEMTASKWDELVSIVPPPPDQVAP
ncbi:MAG: hypothetical protein H0T59_00845 [Chloroflexi bacterium]|nr:hypothetical protein [Chloroflexota bacterium]